MGSVPNFDHDLLCSLISLICLYYSTETPSNSEFPTAPGDSTSMILMYPHAGLGLFQKARSTMEKGSSPLKILVIAPPERKQCIEMSVFSPSARARLFRACTIFAVVMGDLPRMGAPHSALREMLGNKHPRDTSRPRTNTNGTRGQTLVIVCDRNKMIDSISYGLTNWKLKRNPLRFGSLKMRCMSVRLSSPPRFVVSKATVNRARSRATTTRVYGLDAHCKRALNGDTMTCR